MQDWACFSPWRAFSPKLVSGYIKPLQFVGPVTQGCLNVGGICFASQNPFIKCLVLASAGQQSYEGPKPPPRFVKFRWENQSGTF